MKRVLFSLLLLSTAISLTAEEYAHGPDSQPQDGVPRGTVTKFVLPPGKYYPGTPHNCAVYVPAQYDASKPTPFMIFLDGSQALGDALRVPTVFDNLIAKHDLPPMIAIFVDPGILPAISDADQSRYNRVYEYDSLTPRFAEFLLNEMIPAVEKDYNLSQNPDDRGLSGVSTGAVGAFMAPWNRPDQFHRVLSLIGTFVSMKGADALPGGGEDRYRAGAGHLRGCFRRAWPAGGDSHRQRRALCLFGSRRAVAAGGGVDQAGHRA